MDILKQIDGMYSLSFEAAWEDYGIGGNKNAADLTPPMKFDRITRAYLNSGETPERDCLGLVRRSDRLQPVGQRCHCRPG